MHIKYICPGGKKKKMQQLNYNLNTKQAGPNIKIFQKNLTQENLSVMQVIIRRVDAGGVISHR